MTLKERYFALFGVVGPLIAMFFIGASIFLSPWFSWSQNALSDLGHSINSTVAPIFNFGLLLAGFFVIYYSLTSLRSYAKITSYFLAFSGVSLQFIATFDEVYGSLHFIVSVLFFIGLSFASVSYFLEKKSILAVVALIINLFSWILYGLNVHNFGIAVPEAVSSIAAALWVAKSSFLLFNSRN